MKQFFNIALYNLFGRIPKDGSLSKYLSDMRRENDRKVYDKVISFQIKQVNDKS